MGATGASKPLAWASSASDDSTVSFRLRIFFSEARKRVRQGLKALWTLDLTYLFGDRAESFPWSP